MDDDPPEFRECFDRKGKMKRLKREKALKKPYLREREKLDRIINRRNETLIIRVRNEEEEKEPEKVSIEKEKEDSRRPPRKCTIEEIIAVTIDDLDDRWKETHPKEEKEETGAVLDLQTEDEEDQIGAVLDFPMEEDEEDQIGFDIDFPMEEEQRIGVVPDLPMGDEGEGDALPEDFKARIREMNGTNLILVLEKRLFQTDVTKGENRLSIPANQKRKKFLTEEEEEILRAGERMKVVLIHPSLEVSTITLKMWKMKMTCHLYVLTSQWNSVVTSESLEKDDRVQIWTFRVGRELGFALVRV